MLFTLAQFIKAAIIQGIPLLFGATGEIITEKSGNLNLGIPGIMSEAFPVLSAAISMSTTTAM